MPRRLPSSREMERALVLAGFSRQAGPRLARSITMAGYPDGNLRAVTFPRNRPQLPNEAIRDVVKHSGLTRKRLGELLVEAGGEPLP